MRKHRGKPLGRATDDPRDILKFAEEELKTAPKVKRSEHSGCIVRQAAEKTYLAISTALERLLGENIASESGQRDALARLGKHNRQLPKDFGELKRELHGKCFHGGACDMISVAKAIQRAEDFLNRLPPKAR